MERIQKYLAGQGTGSRRQIDSLLQQGRISVNGRVAKPGDRVEGREKIAIDGLKILGNRRRKIAMKSRLQECPKRKGNVILERIICPSGPGGGEAY